MTNPTVKIVISSEEEHHIAAIIHMALGEGRELTPVEKLVCVDLARQSQARKARELYVSIVDRVLTEE